MPRKAADGRSRRPARTISTPSPQAVIPCARQGEGNSPGGRPSRTARPALSPLRCQHRTRDTVVPAVGVGSTLRPPDYRALPESVTGLINVTPQHGRYLRIPPGSGFPGGSGARRAGHPESAGLQDGLNIVQPVLRLPQFPSWLSDARACAAGSPPRSASAAGRPDPGGWQPCSACSRRHRRCHQHPPESN